MNRTMSHYPHPLLAREGWPFIAASLLITLLAYIFVPAISLLFVLISIFVIQFFRDPARVIPNGKNYVLCPADGRVVAVESTTDPALGKECIKVSVFMNVFNVHSNRVPIAGKVSEIKYHPGAFLNAAVDKASEQNERNMVVIDTELKDPDNVPIRITVVQVAGLIARRILCYIKIGENVTPGQRYGFIRFGSRVDVYLPRHAMIQVIAGQKVKASSTILALL